MSYFACFFIFEQLTGLYYKLKMQKNENLINMGLEINLKRILGFLSTSKISIGGGGVLPPL
jgi:hypothetical protein